MFYLSILLPSNKEEPFFKLITYDEIAHMEKEETLSVEFIKRFLLTTECECLDILPITLR